MWTTLGFMSGYRASFDLQHSRRLRYIAVVVTLNVVVVLDDTVATVVVVRLVAIAGSKLQFGFVHLTRFLDGLKHCCFFAVSGVGTRYEVRMFTTYHTACMNNHDKPKRLNLLHTNKENMKIITKPESEKTVARKSAFLRIFNLELG